MTTALPPEKARKNLLVFHLESVSWQTLHAFPDSFPHLTSLMAEARTYRMHVAAATSTEMVIAAFLHGDDFEMDAAAGLAAPAGNNPSLLNTLRDAGYRAELLCLTAFPERPMLPRLAASIPTLRTTNDFAAFLAAFEAAVVDAPFAIHAWSQVPHTHANLALAGHARTLDDLTAGGCAVADNLLGAMLEILRRHGIAEETTVLVFGDHGDDHWTHGFKTGLTHGSEPYAGLIHTPLVIRDPDLPPGIDDRMASTVDLAATCLDLMGLPSTAPFPHSGRSLLELERRTVAFSQNFTAAQPDRPAQDVRKGFAAMDHAHILMVTSRGLQLFNHRLDPGNHANILHHFDLVDGARLSPAPPARPHHDHFEAAHHLWRVGGLLEDDFARLRAALEAHVNHKHDYVRTHGGETLALLDPEALRRVDRTGRDAFFNREPPPPPPPPPPPAPPPPPPAQKRKRRARHRRRGPIRRLMKTLGLRRSRGRRR